MKASKHRSEVLVKQGNMQARVGSTYVALYLTGGPWPEKMDWVQWTNFNSRIEQAKEAFRHTLTIP